MAITSSVYSLDSFILSHGFSLQLDSHLWFQLRFFSEVKLGYSVGNLSSPLGKIKKYLKPSMSQTESIISSVLPLNKFHSLSLHLHWDCHSPTAQITNLESSALFFLSILCTFHFVFIPHCQCGNDSQILLIL